MDGKAALLQQLRLGLPHQALHRRCGPRPRLQRAHAGPDGGAPAAEGEAAAIPAVGWLWDRKSAQTRQRLREQNFRPKKALGQNFMLDDDVLAAIAAAAGVAPGDAVLEVGPGTGNLTRHLLAAGARVTAVEKDYALHDRLAEEYAGVPALRLVCGDILRQNLPALLDGMREGGSDASGREPAPKVKVVANLPYNITKECLVAMLPLGDRISHIYFMLQDEVGVRLTARSPGAADWRVMNLITQYYSAPQYRFKIDRRKYLPAPKVHGALVEFELLPPPARVAVPSEPRFLALMKKAFSQRRKTMRNSLQPLHSSAGVAAALEALGLNPSARAQDLTLQDFVRFAWQLEAAASGGGSSDSGGGEEQSGESDGSGSEGGG